MSFYDDLKKEVQNVDPTLKDAVKNMLTLT